MQFFRPLPMGTLQSILKHADHGIVRGFRLSVRLGVSGCGEGMLYAPLLTELLEVVARELGSIVGDDLVGDLEASDYVRPQEFVDLEVCYPVDCIRFDPFGEVVSDYQKEDHLPRRHRQFPHYVHAPLSEGPW